MYGARFGGTAHRGQAWELYAIASVVLGLFVIVVVAAQTYLTEKRTY